MNSSAAALLAMRAAAESPFTVSQWQELEHQALIFKYLMAGQPIPLDLVLPIQKSFESVSARFFHHPNMAYCSFYGKKVDPEPGRCRRTDGKKWRCSKDAYPDSKYCEKHMHRGRNRSRKHVESQTVSQSSSTITALQATGGSSSGGSRSFQNLPLHSFGNPPQGGAPGSGSNQSHFNSEVTPYGINNKDHRSVHGYRTEVGEHSFFQASGSNRGLHMDSPLDSAWPLMSSRVASFQTSKPSDNNSILHGDYPQSSLYDSEFSSGEPMKQAGQSLRLFAEWPKTSDSWSVAEAEGSNQTSFSTTQLSISIPMASPDFPTGSPSPHDN